MVCGQVKIGPFGPASGYEDSWLKERKIRSFHTICTGKRGMAQEFVILKNSKIKYLIQPKIPKKAILL